MHPSRRLAAVLLLPPIVFLVMTSWWGIRRILWDVLYNTGASVETLADFFALALGATVAGVFAAAVLAFAAGPWPVLAVALFGLSFSWFGVAIFGDDEVRLWHLVASFFYGMARPTMWACAIIPFARPHEAARNGLLLALWAMANAGALASQFGAWEVYYETGTEFTFGFAATLAGFAACLAAFLGLGFVLTRAREPDPEEPTAQWNWPLIGVAALLSVLVIAYQDVYTWFPRAVELFEALPQPDEWWFALNPVVVLWAGLMGAAAFLVLALMRKNVAGVRLLGIGLIVWGIGAGVLAGVEGTVGVATAIIVLSLGEILVGPLLLSRLGGDLHWRVTTAALALFMGTGTVLSWVIDLGQEHLEVGLVDHAYVPFGLLGAAAGAVLVVVGGRLQERLYSPDVPEAGARSALPL